MCSLHHRCRSLQSCRLYWREFVDHLWEYQDHCSRWLKRIVHDEKNPLRLLVGGNMLEISQNFTSQKLNSKHIWLHIINSTYTWLQGSWESFMLLLSQNLAQMLTQMGWTTKRESIKGRDTCKWIPHIPVSHSIPVHPVTQVQVSMAVQLPLFWQGLVHKAAQNWKST